MKRRIGAILVAGMFLAGTGAVAVAKGPGGSGSGSMVRTKSATQTQTRVLQRKQLRDGSGGTLPSSRGVDGAAKKRGNAYGPGDGTGPDLPQDGTGNGAPSNR